MKRLSPISFAIFIILILHLAVANVDAYPAASTDVGITDTYCPNWAATKTNASGEINLTTAGQTYEYKEVTGRINIKAPNVTVQCVKVNATGILYGIDCHIASGVNCAGGLIQDSEIYDSNSANVLLRGRPGDPVRARRLYIHGGVKDSVKARGDMILEDSYIVTEPTPGSHNDAIQTEAGNNIDIKNNNIIGPYQEQTSAYICKTDQGTINNVRLYGNRFSGGTHTLYLDVGGAGIPPTNVIVANNVWVLDSWKYSSASVKSNASTCLEWWGNTYSDASAFNVPTSASPKGSCAVGVFEAIGTVQAAPASFTPAPATYQTSVNVSISTPETGASIYYTTDGSTPDSGDTLYASPIAISATTTLKAIVIKGGFDDSVVTTGVYTITSSCTY